MKEFAFLSGEYGELLQGPPLCSDQTLRTDLRAVWQNDTLHGVLSVRCSPVPLEMLLIKHGGSLRECIRFLSQAVP